MLIYLILQVFLYAPSIEEGKSYGNSQVKDLKIGGLSYGR